MSADTVGRSIHYESSAFGVALDPCLTCQVPCPVASSPSDVILHLVLDNKDLSLSALCEKMQNEYFPKLYGCSRGADHFSEPSPGSFKALRRRLCQTNIRKQDLFMSVDTLQTASAPVKFSKTSGSSRPSRTFLLIRFTMISIVSCCAGCAHNATQTVTSSTAEVSKGNLKSIAKTLKSDPRFSDFVNVVDLAGLGWSLDDATNVTVFAPTNLAFETSDPAWRTRTSLNGTGNGGTDSVTRQTLMKEAGLAGIHPPQEFVGKVQDVRSLGGQVFHVDGRTPGIITISTGAKATSGIGFNSPATSQIAHATLPPISAKGGLIYPVDAIIVR